MNKKKKFITEWSVEGLNLAGVDQHHVSVAACVSVDGVVDAREGHLLEFGEFYESSKDRCLRALAASLGDLEAAHEALDEAMVRACERWDRLSEHPNPEAWVVRTGINAHRSWWRRLRRSVPLSSEPVSEDPTELIDGVLLAAIRTLSQRQREVVALRLLLDLDTESTARQLGIAPGTVTAQLHRAVTHLREALTNYTGGVG